MLDDRARHDLYRAIEDLLGTQAADTLMALLPPVGRADVATKDDLHQLDARLEARLDARFARERGWADARLAAVEARVEAVDARFLRMDARFSQLEGQIDRSLRDQTRTLLLSALGALVVMSSLCLGAVALAT